MNKFNSIEDAIIDIKVGKPIIIVDDEDRENEGDFYIPAEVANYENITFMINEGRGLMCTPISEEIANKFSLNMMTENNTDNHGTAFTISIDSVNTTTGISAGDRLETILALTNENTKADDFRRPGHIFPLVAKKRGVLARRGHTEAAIDLARISGFKEIGVIIEILKKDGTMARRDDLFEISKKHNLKIITIEDLINYRKRVEKLVKNEVNVKLPTIFGDFNISAYTDEIEEKEYIALIKGNVEQKENVSVRLHSECLTGDVFGSKRCDCREQLHRALKELEEKGEGVLIYLRQEGRGIGIINKLKAYSLQDEGFDTVEANHKLGFEDDLRDYAVAAQIIKDLEIKSVSLKTNNPKKIEGLLKYGVNVVNRENIEIIANELDKKYLKTKKEKMGHMLLQNL